MKIEDFHLESYMAKWEFKTPHLLCCSDPESMSQNELLALADPETLDLWQSLTLGYTQDRGHPILLDEIARLYPGLSSQNILTFAGAEEAIFTAMQTLLQPDDHVICIIPAYQSLYSVAQSIGCQMTFIALDAENSWSLDLNAVKNAVTAKTRMIVINFPHNPTGALITRPELDTLIEIAREANAYLFSDEVFRYLEADEKDRLPAAATLYEKAVSTHALSKSFGMPGLRIGWMVSQDEIALQRMRKFKHYLSICNSSASEILGIIALRSREQIQGRINSILRINREHMERFFAKHSNRFSYIPAKGGTMVFPSLLEKEGIDVFARGLIEQGVLILPASVFSMPGNHFRLGFGRANFRDNLMRLVPNF